MGKASDQGELEPLEKSRGEQNAIAALLHYMKEAGMRGGKVRIGHCCNENAAVTLKNRILKEFSQANVELYPTGGLCSFYAEKGGLLVGFETQPV
ncbi:MAG: hypothetical protein E7477_03615 [Ruminococcaceae bacterium]|nr:hypothetical protein [Oscillospiraceae bacterium]